MKTTARNEASTNDLDINKGTDLSSLREKTGFVSRIKANIATSKAAGKAIKEIEVEKVQAEARIAFTAIKLGEAAIRAALVGSAMPKIGALATRVNAATTAVDQALTNGAAAEVYTHINNRTSNVNLANELHTSGKINKEEKEVITSFAQADAAEDIERSRQRMADAKEAVATLHGFTVKGIADSKNNIF